MIKIIFQPLSNQNASYLNTYFAEGYLKPIEQDIIPVSSEYNGENHVIQNIVYDAYQFYFYPRNDEYTEFLNIQSTSKINIYEIGNDRRFNGEEFEFIEFESGPFSNEFWEVKVSIRLISSKNIENIIDKTINDIFTINENKTVKFTCNVPFVFIDNIDFINNLADDFKEKLTDFNKTAPYKEVRLYLNNSDMISFFDNLKEVNNFGAYKIVYKSIFYRQFEAEKQPIGNGLFEIDIKLYSNIEITA